MSRQTVFVNVKMTVGQANAVRRMVQERLAGSPEDWKDAVGCSAVEAVRTWQQAEAGNARILDALEAPYGSLLPKRIPNKALLGIGEVVQMVVADISTDEDRYPKAHPIHDAVKWLRSLPYPSRGPAGIAIAGAAP